MNANIDISKVVLETDRLLLRAWRNDDLEDFYEYASVEGVGEMAGWVHHQSKDESEMILDMFIKGKKTFAISLKENQKVIGSIGIEEYDVSLVDDSFHDIACREIGYVLSKDYWGRGIMPEAVQAVLNYCFENLKLDALFCGYFVRNKQSKRVIEKCGFQFYKDITIETRYGSEEKTKLNVLHRDEYLERKR